MVTPCDSGYDAWARACWLKEGSTKKICSEDAFKKECPTATPECKDGVSIGQLWPPMLTLGYESCYCDASGKNCTKTLHGFAVPIWGEYPGNVNGAVVAVKGGATGHVNGVVVSGYAKAGSVNGLTVGVVGTDVEKDVNGADISLGYNDVGGTVNGIDFTIGHEDIGAVNGVAWSAAQEIAGDFHGFTPLGIYQYVGGDFYGADVLSIRQYVEGDFKGGEVLGISKTIGGDLKGIYGVTIEKKVGKNEEGIMPVTLVDVAGGDSDVLGVNGVSMVSGNRDGLQASIVDYTGGNSREAGFSGVKVVGGDRSGSSLSLVDVVPNGEVSGANIALVTYSKECNFVDFIWGGMCMFGEDKEIPPAQPQSIAPHLHVTEEPLQPEGMPAEAQPPKTEAKVEVKEKKTLPPPKKPEKKLEKEPAKIEKPTKKEEKTPPVDDWLNQ